MLSFTHDEDGSRGSDPLDAVEEPGPDEQLRPPHSALDRFTLYVRLVEGWSKVRRYWLSRFRPGYVTRMRRLRRGQCVRCGSCCAIMFKCPDLDDGSHCRIYTRRHRQCANFPIDHRDLRYLEDVCGFYFVRDDDA